MRARARSADGDHREPSGHRDQDGGGFGVGASLLARPDSRRLLIVAPGSGAGVLVGAYAAVFPDLERVTIWARRVDRAKALAASFADLPMEVRATPDLATAEAHIVSSTTMDRDPILLGAWIGPGTHVDLIGAYKSDMREADDELIATGSLFVDSRDRPVGHIGELDIPINRGVVTADHISGDLYELIRSDAAGRLSDEELAVFKNGGGAHLDLMIARDLSDLVGERT